MFCKIIASTFLEAHHFYQKMYLHTHAISNMHTTVVCREKMIRPIPGEFCTLQTYSPTFFPETTILAKNCI